jgi:RHS repeat-associated protein
VADGDGGNRAKYADYTYLGAGTIVKVAHPQVTGGLALTYGTGGTYGGFDRFGRVVDQRWQNDTPAVLDQFKYGYDRASNRIWRDVGPDMGTPPTGKDEFYIYDGLHRLIKANRGTLAGSPLTIADADAGASQAWAAWSGSQWQSRLDALGNWPMFKQDDNGGGSGDSGWELSQTRLHNKVNEIDNNDSHSDAPSGSITGGSWVLPVHDAAGNMTCAPRPGQESTANEGLLMVYDAWNRQAAVYRDANGDGTKDANDPLIQEARYDGLNRRITKIVRHVQGETVTYDRTDYYYNEGWQCLEERTGSHASLGEYPPNASGARGTVATAVKVQWLWDIRYIDAPVLRWRDADNDENHTLEETLYYCDDANMNVTALVNASGAVVERYAYDPYGKVTILDGTTGGQTEWAADADQKSDVDNEILYCGYRLDPETGLYQVRHRSYHPTLGRFVQRDPIWYANGMSLYAYVSYRPCSLRDPMGLAIAWDDTAYENVIEPSIGKAIKSGTLQTESTIQGKDFSANDCMGTKGCNVKFTFTRAMKGDYSVFGIQYSGVYVGIKVSATAACCCDMVLLIQVASPFKMEKGKKVRTGADTDDKRSRQGWENPNAPSRGWAVDSGDGESSPFYDTGNPGLAKYKQPAWMWDAPAAPSTARNEGLDIITCAICYNKTKDNKQEGRKWAGNLLACLQWGFYVNASGAVDFAPSLPAASDETPQTFVNALKRFEGIPGNESAGIEGISRETPTTIEGVWLTRH